MRESKKLTIYHFGKCLFSFLALSCLLVGTDSAAQNFWKPTNGPYGGYIKALAINGKGHIFAGTIGGGIFRSTNNGASWTAANVGLPKSDRISVVTEVEDIVIDTSGNLYAGMSSGGVFRSQNNGGNWTAINNGLPEPHVSSLAISPNGDIFAGMEGGGGGIFRSKNRGKDWAPVNNGLILLHITALAINSRGHIFAGTGGLGVYRSTNNGESWTKTSLNEATIPALAINAHGDILPERIMPEFFALRTMATRGSASMRVCRWPRSRLYFLTRAGNFMPGFIAAVFSVRKTMAKVGRRFMTVWQTCKSPR